MNLDQEIIQSSSLEIESLLKGLEQKLGSIILDELDQNISRGGMDTPAITSDFAQEVHRFYHSEYIEELEREKKIIFESIGKEKEKINRDFAYLTHHFGKISVPKNILFLNTLFSPILCYDSTIIISLENYISPDTEIIQSIPSEELYGWQRSRMNANFIARDVLLSWIQVNLFQSIDGTFAEEIIHAGKILYVLNAAFPNETEAFILRYSTKETNWASKNEELIWDFLVKNKMLFKNDERDKANFLNEGSTTIGLPDESPDRIGQFIGYRIVKGYMLKNKSVSLHDLVTIPYNNILQTYKIE